ncbi:PKD domain-containing protein [Paraburkholderia caribensis]|nr:hypothetical protein [Paraburkholderia caribensis]CAG9240597.1 conserved hypothetical protein [Paraburkholderia caribensis]
MSNSIPINTRRDTCGDPRWDMPRRGHVFFLHRFAALLMIVAQLCWISQAMAQLPPPGTPSQFDIVGFLQEATLNGPNPTATTGGKLKVNGHVVVVPDNTIVMLPANALTWQELFAQAPAPYTNIATGMALADSPAPLTTYEVHVIGNRVGDTYIAGLIFLSQQDLNAGAGYINYIDYGRGEMYVGGTLNVDGAGVPRNVLDPNNPGTRISINDPAGRYGRTGSPDQRFTLDPDNPTVRSTTGFPMCLPRTDPNDPSAVPDALCPEGNRPKDVTGNFVATVSMPDPKTIAAGQLPDPRIMAPFEVGDFVDYAGTLVRDSGTSGPYPSGSSGTYISAHTITDNVAIYTAPGTDPAYVAVEVTIIGTGGLTVLGAGEAVVRTRFEGMTTDPSRNVHLYGLDFNPSDGKISDRDWGVVGVDPGAPNGAVKGRWRFRPPCTVAVPTIKDCKGPSGGSFLPPAREVRAVIEGAWTPTTDPATTGGANGIIAGQYRAPILEFIFPENVPGTPPPPNNFETIPFLAQGGYVSSANTLVGQLKPWPGREAPGTCVAPTASAGADFNVASGATNVPLSGSATGNGQLTYAWTAVSPSNTVITNSTSPNATFNALTIAPGGASQTMVFSLTVTGCNNKSATSTVTVTVLPPQQTTPVISPIAPVTVNSGTPVRLTAVGSGPAPLTYTWTQTAGPSQAFTQQPAGDASISFTRAIPIGKITNDVLTFQVVAKTTTGATSAPVSVTVTVKPVADTVTITAAVYRTSKQRLDLTVTSSIVNPNLTLTLQPYQTALGTTFDPSSLGATLTNTGGGTYTLTLVGAPQPTAPPARPLVVKSSIGGTSPATALTNLRN